MCSDWLSMVLNSRPLDTRMCLYAVPCGYVLELGIATLFVAMCGNRGLSRFLVPVAGFVFVVHEHFRRTSTMAETKARCHCSVPLCTSNKQHQPYLSFHGFPTEMSLRKKWIQAVRRDEGPNFKIKQGSTFVCSRHFSESDYTNATASNQPGSHQATENGVCTLPFPVEQLYGVTLVP